MILSIMARENPANWTVDLSDFGGQGAVGARGVLAP